MRRAIRVWRRSVAVGFMSAMSYRADFILSLFISLAGNLALPMITLLIYGSGAAYPGWSLYEALLLQSIFTICNGICSIFFTNLVWEVMSRIKDGTFDLIMLRPGPAALHSLCGAFDLSGTGPLAGGIFIFIYSLSRLGPPSPVHWAGFGMMLILGIIVVFGCVMIMAATAFKWVGNSRISEIFGRTTDFGKYPLGIFPKAVRAVISFAVPVAALGSLPAEALLGRMSPVMLLAALPCVLFAALGCLLFGHMIRLYQSAGG